MSLQTVAVEGFWKSRREPRTPDPDTALRPGQPVASIFSGCESVIEDKAINDSLPADLFTLKVDFGIKFLDRRI